MTEEKAPRLRGWASPFVYPTALFIRDYLRARVARNRIVSQGVVL
jgi:hypothetical protein